MARNQLGPVINSSSYQPKPRIQKEQQWGMRRDSRGGENRISFSYRLQACRSSFVPGPRRFRLFEWVSHTPVLTLPPSEDATCPQAAAVGNLARSTV
jgi:hypothetical protein